MELVTREKTFNDNAIDELAEVNASCTLRLQFGRCKFEECKNCSLYKQRNNCYKNMNDYDRARLHQRTSERYAILSMNPEPYYSSKRIAAQAYGMLFVTIALVIITLIFFLVPAPNDIKPKKTGVKTDATSGTNYMIVDTLAYVHDAIYDVDKDNIVNCRDYSYLFKYYFDSKYSEYATCRIVYNYNIGTGMCHLFVAVEFSDIIFCVEPQSNYDENYMMQDVWGSQYDPAFNRTDSVWCIMPYIKQR